MTAPTVLLVEDEAMLREVISAELLDRGYDVIEATDGRDALRLSLDRSIGLLLTDIRLPGDPDGWGIAKVLRERSAGLPVIYMTGYATGHEKAVPGSVMLTKPFTPDQLETALARVGAASPG
jgi:CheY-like chemotaxis protein